MTAKRWIALVLIVLMAASLFVGCKPATEEEEGVVGGSSNTDPNNPNSPSDPSDPNSPSNPNNPNNPSDPSNPNSPSNPSNPNSPSNPSNPSNPGGGKVEITEGMENFTVNPITVKGKKFNTEALPSYNLDRTGFMKNFKLADFKGKSLTIYTAVDYAVWNYKNKSGKTVNSWDWLKLLKSELGVTLKYVRTAAGGGNNVMKQFQAMSSGKDIDVVMTHVSSFPYVLNILRPLDPYVNVNNITNSPGLDPRMTSQLRWKGNNVVVGAAGCYGAMWYKKTSLQNYGVTIDPYTEFKKGTWTWDTYKKFCAALPVKAANGRRVYGYADLGQATYYWPCTNGTQFITIDGEDPNGGIINNYNTQEVKSTYLYLEDVNKSTGAWPLTASGGSAANNYWGAPTATADMVLCYSWLAQPPGLAEGKEVVAWVPYPRNQDNPKAINHVQIYGFGCGVSRKLKNEQNAAAAAKFCELWCNRFCETQFDRLQYVTKFTYEQAKEYYEFGRTNGIIGLGSGLAKVQTMINSKNGCFLFNSFFMTKYNTAQEYEKGTNFVKQAVIDCQKFGLQ